MPLQRFHSCRVRSPDLFKSNTFKTLKTKTKGLSIIVAELKDTNKTALQAFRYEKSIWKQDRASSHCSKGGGRFEAASTKKNKELLSDHTFMHIVWKKVKDGESWYGWSKDEVIEEHSKLVDELRSQGYSMTPRTSLGELSKSKEKSYKSLKPADINSLLNIKKKSKKYNLSEHEIFSELSLFDEISMDLPYISLIQSEDKIVISLRGTDRNTELEKKIREQFPEALKKELHFDYSKEGPSNTHVPLYDLVLKPRKLELFELNPSYYNFKINKKQSVEVEATAKEAKTSDCPDIQLLQDAFKKILREEIVKLEQTLSGSIDSKIETSIKEIKDRVDKALE